MSSGAQVAADSRNAHVTRTTAEQPVSARLVSKTRSGELASFRRAKVRQLEPAQQVNKAQPGNWVRFVQPACESGAGAFSPRPPSSRTKSPATRASTAGPDLGLASFRTTPRVLTPASFRPPSPSNEV